MFGMVAFGDDMRRNPFPLYQQMRAVSPVLEMPGMDMWMVLDHDGVKRALTDHESFSSSVSRTQGHGFEWLLFMDPPRHTHLRALVSKAFTPRSIAALEPRVRELSRGLLDGIGAEVDLVAGYAAPLPMMVIAEMLGLPAEDWARLRGWADTIMDLALTIVGDDAEASAASLRFEAADAEMRAYVAALAGARRAEPRDDLLTRLVLAEVDGAGLGPDEVLRFLQLLLVAGTETTTNLIGNAVISLLEHPGELARLRASPSLVPSAIEEILRYRSPAHIALRATVRDVELGGARIPGGKLVLASIGSANRDPRQFADPERLDVGRDPNPHVAFGHGIHFCIGAALSRLEGRIALADLLPRLDGAELATTAWEPRRAFNVHGPARLPVRFRATSASSPS